MPENTLYVQQEAEDGTTTYVEVTEETEISLPENLITGSAQYQELQGTSKKAIRESKKRLKRAQTAEAQLVDVGSSDEDDTTPQPTVDEFAAEVLAKVYAQQAEDKKVKTEKETAVNALMTTHKLGGIEGIREAMLAENMEEVAAIMGRQKYQFGESSGGETPVLDNMDDFLNKVDGLIGFVKDEK